MDLQLAGPFKWMPSVCLWFTVIAAPPQLEKKLFLMEQIKAKQDCVHLSAYVHIPVYMNECDFALTPSVSSLVMHMIV